MGHLIEAVLSLENLRAAWNAVAENRGMPGVDNVTIHRWQRTWEERLVQLARDVRANHYKPAKLRTRRIPKRKRNEYRTLRIPTVTDRVLQRAVLQVLYRIYEPRFLPCSFGYRPGKSLPDAVRRIVVLRAQDYVWVLDADIDDFFDNVDLTLLNTMLREDINDPLLLRLIQQWLKQGVVKEDPERGIPMGSPLSPLLANVYMHPLDVGLEIDGWPVVRYADDFIVLACTREMIEIAYVRTEGLLASLKLRYEPSKTAIVSFEEGFDFLGVTFEEDTYSYPWENKIITVAGDRVDQHWTRINIKIPFAGKRCRPGRFCVAIL